MFPTMELRVTKGCGLDCEKELLALDIFPWGELVLYEPNIVMEALHRMMSTALTGGFISGFSEGRGMMIHFLSLIFFL